MNSEIGGTVDEALGDDLTAIVRKSMAESARSEWSNTHKIGVSDIGHCREYMRRMLVQEPFTDEQGDYAAAFMGTAVGEAFEAAYRAHDARAITQSSLPVALNIPTTEGVVQITLNGHPDVIDTDLDLLLDGKSKDGLGVVRREGGSRQQKYQVHLYAKGAIDAGLLSDEPTVGLAFMDRSGGTEKVHAVTWTYDPAVIAEIEQWIGDVLYAVAHGEEASRDQPRSWCERCCPFYTGCRLGDYAPSDGRITDQEALTAVDVYLEAAAAEKAAKAAKKSAKATLKNVNGRTSTHTVRLVEVGSSEYSVNRAGYEMLKITPIKSARAKSGPPVPGW